MCLRSLKRKFIFFFGFLIGFILTILFISIDNNYKLSINTQNSLSKAWKIFLSNNKKWISKDNSEDYESLSYKQYLKDQSVKIKNIDMDKMQYGPDDSENLLIESDWLKSKVHVTCVVLVEKLKLAKTIKETWGPRCNKIYFFSRDNEDPRIPVVNISSKKKLVSSWQMLCEIMHKLWNDFDKNPLEWVIFVKDDTIIVPENLRHLIAHLDYNKNYYLGHPVVFWGQTYNVAEAGYVLSRGALTKIIKKFDSNDKCVTGGKYWKKEDYDLGKNLASLNIYPIDMRDSEKRGTFHGYSLQTLLFGVAKPGSYFTKALFPPGDNCCSPRSVTFSVTESDKVYTLNYILYYLNIYRQVGRYGNIPASTPVPEDEVWKISLKEEFNLTDVEDLSNDDFYNIWKSKYREPGQFINNN